MFYCNACYVQIKVGEVGTATSCGHLYCRSCFGKILAKKSCIVCGTVRGHINNEAGACFHGCCIVTDRPRVLAIAGVRWHVLEGRSDLRWDTAATGSGTCWSLFDI